MNAEKVEYKHRRQVRKRHYNNPAAINAIENRRLKRVSNGFDKFMSEIFNLDLNPRNIPIQPNL